MSTVGRKVKIESIEFVSSRPIKSLASSARACRSSGIKEVPSSRLRTLDGRAPPVHNSEHDRSRSRLGACDYSTARAQRSREPVTGVERDHGV